MQNAAGAPCGLPVVKPSTPGSHARLKGPGCLESTAINQSAPARVKGPLLRVPSQVASPDPTTDSCPSQASAQDPSSKANQNAPAGALAKKPTSRGSTQEGPSRTLVLNPWSRSSNQKAASGVVVKKLAETTNVKGFTSRLRLFFGAAQGAKNRDLTMLSAASLSAPLLPFLSSALPGAAPAAVASEIQIVKLKFSGVPSVELDSGLPSRADLKLQSESENTESGSKQISQSASQSSASVEAKDDEATRELPPTPAVDPTLAPPATLSAADISATPSVDPIPTAPVAASPARDSDLAAPVAPTVVQINSEAPEELQISSEASDVTADTAADIEVTVVSSVLEAPQLQSGVTADTITEVEATVEVSSPTPASNFPALEVPVPDASLPADVPSLDDGSVVFAAGLALGVAALVGAASLLFRKGYAGEVAPEDALKLVEDGRAVLLDVRTAKEKREDGSPFVKPPGRDALLSAKGTVKVKGTVKGTVRGTLRSQSAVVAVPFLKPVVGDEYEPDESFVEGVTSGKAAELSGNIIVVDSSGAPEIAVAAAKALTSAGLKNVKVLKGGSDAWKEAGLPWKEPKLRPMSLPSLPSLSVELTPAQKEQISQGLKAAAATAGEAGKGLPVALAVTAAAGAALAVIVEAEAIMQLVASITAGQFLLRKFLFAKDREETIAQLKAFVTKDTAAKQDEAQTAAESAPTPTPAANGAAATGVPATSTAVEPTAITPETTTPPAPTPAPEAPAAAAAVQTTIAPETREAEAPAPALAEAAAPSAAGAAPAAPVGGADSRPASTDLPPADRPLSPFSLYPDLKPPTSPTPAAPTGSQATPPGTWGATPTPEEPVVSKPKSTDLPRTDRPLSPYALYPDLKPPASPTPRPPQ